ncbi:MAG: hypothetical protein ACKVHE_15810 [Planctomycetales bacterium]
MFDLDAQGLTWSVGYGTLVGLAILCGILTARELRSGAVASSDNNSGEALRGG